MRSILFLSDSVNRRFMECYSQSGLHLKNLDRLAKRSVIFDNHWTGSAPCMPARRDIMTGRLNFLERYWGPIEAFDYTLPRALKKGGINSHIITDHYHYFEIGAENYCQMFPSWELVRGQEWDPCISPIGKGDMPEHIGKMVPQYWYNHQTWKDNKDLYPSAQVITKAADWLEERHDCDDFFLWVEIFDPHEPFDVPQEYLDKVHDTYHGPMYVWPEYKNVHDAGLDEESIEHARKRYLALFYMTDDYLGKIFDVMDRYDMWKDTMFIYTTDHGYMLGEHDLMAKNYMCAYNEVFHIPLMIHLPEDECAGLRINALTQNIDLMPTIMELHGVRAEGNLRNPLHGKSLIPLMKGGIDKVRDAAIYGYFGKQINITDGRYTYFRAPNRENRPLNMYTSMMTDTYTYFDYSELPGDKCRLNSVDQISCGRYLKWTKFPVYRIPVDALNEQGLVMKCTTLFDWELQDQLYDLQEDYGQNKNIVASDPETVLRMENLLRKILLECDCPEEQFERMRLGSPADLKV